MSPLEELYNETQSIGAYLDPEVSFPVVGGFTQSDLYMNLRAAGYDFGRDFRIHSEGSVFAAANSDVASFIAGYLSEVRS
jgi:hypothetical protein